MTVDAFGIPIDPEITRVGDPGTRGRDVYVAMDRLYNITATVTEFFDQDRLTRFLACTCPEFQGTKLICAHIQKVYEERLDIYEVPEDESGTMSNTGVPTQRIALPFEIDGDYETLVVIMGYKYKLAVRVTLRPFGAGSPFVEPHLIVPVAEQDTYASLGVAPREVGRGELRTMFIEWITTEMVTRTDMACKGEWHEAWKIAREEADFEPSRERDILNHWLLLCGEFCAYCATNPDVPVPYNPIEGALRRARNR